MLFQTHIWLLLLFFPWNTKREFLKNLYAALFHTKFLVTALWALFQAIWWSNDFWCHWHATLVNMNYININSVRVWNKSVQENNGRIFFSEWTIALLNSKLKSKLPFPVWPQLESCKWEYLGVSLWHGIRKAISDVSIGKILSSKSIIDNYIT